MAKQDTELLQVLIRQTAQNRLIYVILAEDRLILPEAKAPQPDHNVHGRRLKLRVPHIIVPPGEGVQDWPRYIVQKSEALLRFTMRASRSNQSANFCF